MDRTVEENRAILKRKAKWIRDQEHFDRIMELFPVELREEIYQEIEPLLTKPLKLNKAPKVE